MKKVLILAAALAAVAVAASAQPPAGGPPMGAPPMGGPPGGAAGGAGGPGGPGGAGGRGPAPFDPAMPLAGCTRCHGAMRNGALIAPDLKGIYGAKIAGHADFAGYSDALKAKTGVWDDKTLDAFLKDSKADVPDTKMNQKVPDADRAIIITYLKTYK